MTGETKIGLITGLSVIIVFAMILSHKSGGPDRITPPLRTPDVHSEYLAEQPEPEPAAVALPEPIPPAPELNDESRTVAVTPEAGESVPTTPFDPGKFVSVENREDSDEPQPVMTEALRRAIEGAPPAVEETRHPKRPASQPPPLKPLRRATPDEPERVYIAQANDNLTRIAARLLGSGSVRNVNLIYELNRDTMPDKDSLQVGQKIRLPSQAAGPAAGRRSARRREPAQPTRTRTYQVQPGDTYAAIAQGQLGSSKRWREVFELNRDRFPDPDLIQAGATIRLPTPAPGGIRLASR